METEWELEFERTRLGNSTKKLQDEVISTTETLSRVLVQCYRRRQVLRELSEEIRGLTFGISVEEEEKKRTQVYLQYHID